MSWLSDEAVDRLCAVANWPEFESDRYTVTQEIGRGGMGCVYAAIDEALGREVALKVTNTIASAAFERRLEAEARVLARLEHPGIVPVHDVGRLADGRLFYVMKRVHGQTLREHLRLPCDLGERLRIFERICEAVAFAHAHGILHRDLKPDNVMVGSFGEVMVLDWGVAKTLSPVQRDDVATIEPPSLETPAHLARQRTHQGTVVGTHGFMSPEQARGETDSLDQRADVYALGAMLLDLLNGPVPPPLRSVCARAMAASPVDRYPSASALGDDVARYRAGQAVQAHRESLLERATRVATIYRTPILLVLAYMIMRAIVAFTAGF